MAVDAAKWRRRARRLALPALLAAYGLLVAYPGVLFAHHQSYGAFRVASDAPLGPGLPAVLDRALEKLARSPLFDPAAVHRVYVAGGRVRRFVLAPTSPNAFGVTYPVRRNTVLNRVDVAADLVFNDAPRHNRRSLSGVIAHERTHALVMDRYGAVGSRFLPTWKVEGYCDYVAGESSFDAAEGRRLLRAGSLEGDGSPSFRYFRDRLTVAYLLDVEGWTVDDLFARDADPAALRAKVVAALDRLLP